MLLRSVSLTKIIKRFGIMGAAAAGDDDDDDLRLVLMRKGNHQEDHAGICLE